MKFVIVPDNKKAKAVVKEEIMYLKLVPIFGSQEGVKVVACDEFGVDLYCGNILSIDSKGIHIHPGTGSGVNLPKEANGKVIIR